MFEDLVSGKENSPLILVQDTVNHRGNCILNYITQGLLNRLDLVILYMLDKHSKNLINSDRLYVYDGLSDPLGWTASRSLSSDPISKPFLFKNILTKTVKNNEKLTLLLSENSFKKVGIIINSLSAVISHQNIAVVCKDLCEVISYHTQTFEVSQTVALVHSDLHSESLLSSLNYIATTCIELKDFVDEKEGSGHFIITHCKKSGKLNKKGEEYKIDSDFQLTIIHTENKNNIEVKTTSSESEDITSNLTFNLTLTEEQQQARAKLQLPYLLDDKIKQAQLDLGKKSQIFYEADEADDLDEEDPDDDLNI